jgi:ornithine--oxo-acid transaminase
MEAIEGSVKVARRWGCEVKGVKTPMVLVAEGGRWFRRLTTAISSDDKPWYNKAHPNTAGYCFVPYDDLCALEVSYIIRSNSV